MAIANKRKLSGSSSGRAVKLTQTSSEGNIIHTAVAGTTDGTYDEIWIWAYSGHDSDILLTIEFGGVEAPDQNIITEIPHQSGLIPIVPGLILQNGYIVKAFAEVANVITLIGFVNSITD